MRSAAAVTVLLAVAALATVVIFRPSPPQIGPTPPITTATPAPTGATQPPIGVSIRDHGAAGDGITDDTSAILRARDAAGAGGRVIFPYGTYRFTRPLSLNVARQEWVLQSGAVLKAGATIFLDAPGVRLSGPGAIDEQQAKRMGVEITFNAATPADGAVVSGVEIYGTRGDYCALILADGDYARIENNYLHDSGCDGGLINTDRDTGHRGIEFRGNRLVNIVRDAIHSKGTNGDWRGGVWIPEAERNVGHKFIGNVMERVAQVPNTFSLEIQDGHVDAEIRDNRADQTFSIVGQLRAQVTGNTFSGHGDQWAMEIGNFRDGTVRGNTFSNCRVGIAMTGGKDQLNVGNVFADNKYEKCGTRVSVAWDGGGNRYLD